MSVTVNNKFQIESKYNRHFSEDFKRSKVKDLLAKRIRVRELCCLYSISRATVYKWLYLYSNVEKSTKTVVQMESEYCKTQLLLARIAELERAVGQKQMEIDYQNKAFELASEELGFDIKKKYGQPPLNTFAEEKASTITR